MMAEKKCFMGMMMDDADLFKNFPTPASLMDENGKRIATNLAAKRLFGRSRDEITEAKLEELYTKEDAETIKDAFEESKRTGHSACDATCLKGDGTTFPVISNFTSVRDEKGDIINVLVTATDITELKERERELKAETKYISDLFNATPDPINIVDADDIRIYCNPAMEELTGLSMEELIGKPANMVFVEEERKNSRRIIDGIIEGGHESGLLRTILAKDGRRIPVSAHIHARRDADGKVIGAIVNLRDITELKEREEELEAKNTEMERFIYTVSHDLRSPLITISGFAGMLKRDIEKNKREEIETDLMMILDAVGKMDRLLKDTLELSRIGRITNPPEDASFKDIVQEALKQMAGDIGSNEKDIEITAKDSIRGRIVYVDKERIVEVLTNLISNSIRYMGDQPEPKIDIGYLSDENVFFVRDNGIGIPPDQHEKVFGLFYKMDKDSEGEGTGLAIVKRIVEVHGGQIWIESEGKNREGSTFCFTLLEKNQNPDGYGTKHTTHFVL
ncbi:MAG: sensory histidine kinase AtoS [Candidatus Methanolliviera sp. GoM_oil]|nr:MAG: sensory histidine kinase AtoS [Candidatus Methanolliviera sp. GoM_oil]